MQEMKEYKEKINITAPERGDDKLFENEYGC